MDRRAAALIRAVEALEELDQIERTCRVSRFCDEVCQLVCDAHDAEACRAVIVAAYPSAVPEAPPDMEVVTV